MQNFTNITSSTTLQNSLAELLGNDETALSNSAGTVFPTTNLYVGMFCLRTDLWQLYMLTATSPSATWQMVCDLNKTYIYKELTNTLYAALSHTHDASNIVTGTIALARLPTIPTTMLSGIDNSLRLTSTYGLQVNEPMTKVSGTYSLTAANHFGNLVATANAVAQLPAASSMWNGYCVSGYAQAGTITWTPSGSDTINSGTGGASVVSAVGSSQLYVCDGVSNWVPFWSGSGSNSGGIAEGVATGTGNAQSVTISGASAALGQQISVTCVGSNSSNAPSLSLNGGNFYPITINGGKTGYSKMIPNANYEALFKFTAKNTWELLNPAPQSNYSAMFAF